MTARNSQGEGIARLTPAIRKSVHRQLVDLHDGVRAVASRNHLRDNEVVRVAIDEERRMSAKREEEAYRAGRRSVLVGRVA